MYLQTIMILGALFGFIYALRLKETYSRVINWAMVVAVGISFTTIAELKVDGYYLFALTQLGVIVYGFSYPEFSNSKKITVIGSGLLSFIPMAVFLSAAVSFYAEIALITGLIQLGIFANALKSEIRGYKEEVGFLVILAADALVRVIGGLMFFI
jgi:hypothetical protein